MPSPFPGMDPFIESQGWSDFHTRLIAEISNALMPNLRPRYEVKVERRVYIEPALPEGEPSMVPDVAILSPRQEPWSNSATAVVEPSTAVATLEFDMPWREERREAYLVIRDLTSHRLVTIIEVLSPSNKRHGGKGRRKFLAKREAVLDSATNWVEIDLLRGGERTPLRRPWPRGDYAALVARAANLKSRCAAYAWPLAQPIPAIPIPLDPGVPDVMLDLQSAVTMVYDRAGYDYTLRYAAPVQPPLSPAESEWVAEILKRRTPAS